MSGAIRDELLAIFPQHTVEVITQVYNSVVNELSTDAQGLVLSACMEQLLTLPATKVDKAPNRPQKKTKDDIYPPILRSDSEESDSDDSDMLDPLRVDTMDLSRSNEDDSLLGYLSDQEDALFAAAAGLNNNVITNEQQQQQQQQYRPSSSAASTSERIAATTSTRVPGAGEERLPKSKLYYL